MKKFGKWLAIAMLILGSGWMVSQGSAGVESIAQLLAGLRTDVNSIVAGGTPIGYPTAGTITVVKNPIYPDSMGGIEITLAGDTTHDNWGNPLVVLDAWNFPALVVDSYNENLMIGYYLDVYAPLFVQEGALIEETLAVRNQSGGVVPGKITMNGVTIVDHREAVHGYYFEATTSAGAPFKINSVALVTNLNSDLLDSEEGSYYTGYTDSETGNLKNYLLGRDLYNLGRSEVYADAATKNAWIHSNASVVFGSATISTTLNSNTINSTRRVQMLYPDITTAPVSNVAVSGTWVKRYPGAATNNTGWTTIQVQGVTHYVPYW